MSTTDTDQSPARPPNRFRLRRHRRCMGQSCYTTHRRLSPGRGPSRRPGRRELRPVSTTDTGPLPRSCRRWQATPLHLRRTRTDWCSSRIRRYSMPGHCPSRRSGWRRHRLPKIRGNLERLVGRLVPSQFRRRLPRLGRPRLGRPRGLQRWSESRALKTLLRAAQSGHRKCTDWPSCRARGR